MPVNWWHWWSYVTKQAEMVWPCWERDELCWIKRIDTLQVDGTTTTTIIVYFNKVVFPSVLGLTLPSHNILLHLHLSQASSLQSPFFLISSFNTSLHLFLGLPFTPSPFTCSVSNIHTKPLTDAPIWSYPGPGMFIHGHHCSY